MKFKAIIFDLDGTIIDTEHIWKKATRQLIISRGHEYHSNLEIEVQTEVHGAGLTESCLFLKMKFNLPESVPELMHEKAHYANQLYKKELKFINGFIEFHALVKQYDLKHGIATNADDTTVQTTKEALQLEQYFGEHIYGISHVNNKSKPDPAIYLHVAKQLKTDPSHCIVIEDSAHGVAAAKNAGMYCIGINTTKQSEYLKDADKIIEGYNEIDLKTLLNN